MDRVLVFLLCLVLLAWFLPAAARAQMPTSEEFIRDVWVEAETIVIDAPVAMPPGGEAGLQLPSGRWVLRQTFVVPGYWTRETTAGVHYPARWAARQVSAGVYEWQLLPAEFRAGGWEPSMVAQAWPPPPRTVPSIGQKTPDPTTAFPRAVPSIGSRSPDPTTVYPGAIPSIGPKTPDATTAFPGAIPSIGPKAPDPTTAFPGAVPSIGPSTPDPMTVFPNAVPSIGPDTPDPTTAPTLGTSP